MARIDTIISTFKPNGVIEGKTRRITTNVIAGWCGVDFVERVRFVYNTARTLHIYVEERDHYMLKNVRRSSLLNVVSDFLKQDDRAMDNYRVI
jgi:hypothetical protein